MSTKISPTQLQEELNSGKPIFLIDVREPSEYKREHIPQAQLYPMSSFNPEEILKSACDKNVLCVTCASGGRSSTACNKLSEMIKSNPSKYGNIKLLELNGGTDAWRLSGAPLTINKSSPLPIMRQVQIIAGSLILSGTLLTRFVNPNFFLIPAFVGSGLLFAGVTGFCGMAVLLMKLPYNASNVSCKC